MARPARMRGWPVVLSGLPGTQVRHVLKTEPDTRRARKLWYARTPGATGEPRPDGQEERIRRYAARAALRLPLFEPGGTPAPEPGCVCWGCGAVPAQLTHVRKLGWVSRAVVVAGTATRETYCPACQEMPRANA